MKPHVAIMNRYWITDEAARSMHGQPPLPAWSSTRQSWASVPVVASGLIVTPPTRARSDGYDLGMEDWVFEVDATSGEAVTRRWCRLGRDLPGREGEGHSGQVVFAEVYGRHDRALLPLAAERPPECHIRLIRSVEATCAGDLNAPGVFS